MNEKEFLEDLQSFSHFFRSIDEYIHPDDIKPVDKNNNYFVYDFKYNGPENSNFTRKFKNPEIKKIDKDPIFFSGKNLWILKPSGLNRGKGLELFSSLEDLNKFLRMYTTGYAVKEFINMQYSDNDNVSPSLVKSSSQTKLGNLKLSEPGFASAYSASMVDTRLPSLSQTANRDKNKTTFPSFVIQKYIEKPMLFKGFKFDIRAFGLFTHENELFVSR